MARTTGSSAPDTRARILEAAVALLGERGFSGMSIRDLAERAGMTTAALYYHFAGKDEILDALFGPCLDGLRAISAPPGADQARNLLEQLIDLFGGQGRSIQAVMNDQSAMRHVLTTTDFPAVMGGLTRAIAGSDDPHDLIRARCALGALQRGLAVPPGPADPAAGGPTLDPADRAVVIAAALAALHSTP